MKIVYGTFIDNCERAGYRPDICTENWHNCDAGFVFVGDQNEADYVKSLGVKWEIIILNHKINVPSDISRAQNKCFDYMFGQGVRADWVVWPQGDEYITKAGDQYLYYWLRRAESVVAGNVPIMHTHLYAEQWVHQYTMTVSPRMPRLIYDENADGEECHIHNPICPDINDMFLDTSYIGLPQYHTKMYNHQHIWPDAWKVWWLDLYNRDRDEAIRAAYANIKKSKGVGLKSINMDVYWSLIERFDLVEDYKYVAPFMEAFK